MPYNAIEADKRTTRKHKQRHSLQPTTETEEPPSSSFRHTQSHRLKNIPQADAVRKQSLNTVIEIPSEEKKTEYVKERIRKSSSVAESGRTSKLLQKNEIAKEYAYDNVGFDKHSEKISVNNRPKRAPSVQSLGVVREQYCCCSRLTKCERWLSFTVITLILVIILLVIGIVFVAIKQGHLKLGNFNVF